MTDDATKKTGTPPVSTGSVPVFLRRAEEGASDDASRLVASVPALMREVLRRGDAGREASPTLAQLASAWLPRLAAATAVAVIASLSIVSWERSKTEAPGTTAKTFESVVLEGDGGRSGDIIFDALLDAGRSDG